MAYDEGVAQRIRDHLGDYPDLEEKKMFGGIAFLYRGHMAFGIQDRDLMLRLGPDGGAAALQQPHTRPMDFTGRPMKGYIYLSPAGYTAADDLDGWLRKALAFAQSLPPKKPKKKKA